jgi:hypothetical protein
LELKVNIFAAFRRGGTRRPCVGFVVGLILTFVAPLHAQTQTGTIVFYREKHFVNYQYNFQLFCNGAELATIINGSYLQTTAPAGKHSCVLGSQQRGQTEIDVPPGGTTYLKVLVLSSGRAQAVLVNSTLREFDKHKRNLISLAAVQFPEAQADRVPVRPSTGATINVPPANTRPPDKPATPSSMPAGPKAAANNAPAPPKPEVVSAYQSDDAGAVILTLYRKDGDKFTPFALGEVKGRIEFNSHGIVGNIDALQRLQFSEPKDKWLTITHRSLLEGKADITTEDGKSYTIFNLGMKSFAGQIEPSESSSSSAAAVPAAVADSTAKAEEHPSETVSPSSNASAPGGRSATNAARSTPPTGEEPAFLAATQIGTSIGWENFLKQHPAGAHTKEARQSLDSLLYDEALLAQTDESALGNIFRRCKTPEGADKVFALWDDAAFQDAQQLGTSNAYHSYVTRFPKGKHFSAVQTALDGIAWAGCKIRDLKSCRSYVEDYPQGLHSRDAQETIQGLEYESVKSQDSIEGYQKFLADHYDYAPARERLGELLYARAVSTGALADWLEYYDRYRFIGYTDSAAKARTANAEKEIERLMYAEIVGGSTLKMCEDYLGRFREGPHEQQVRIAMEPLLFEAVAKENSIEAYKKYLNAYPQGSFAAQARTSLDPLLFAWASKEDWCTAYNEYLKFCPACSNAEKAEQRLAWLKANPAVPSISFPAELAAPNGRWEWDTVFKETGGKTGFKVDGTGYILTSKGEKYVVQGGFNISRGEEKVPPGGSKKENYWVGNGSYVFCDGDAVFTWTGEDAGGHPVKFDEKVHLKCNGNGPNQ